jgi:large subunit ribosomal protein L21
MYAVIETGGKQYKVSPGDLLDIERLADEPGEPIEFDQVLFYSAEGDVRAGTPTLPGIRVVGSVVDQHQGPKVIAATYKRRTGYRRKKGHRQQLTRVSITRIDVRD